MSFSSHCCNFFEGLWIPREGEDTLQAVPGTSGHWLWVVFGARTCHPWKSLNCVPWVLTEHWISRHILSTLKSILPNKCLQSPCLLFASEYTKGGCFAGKDQWAQCPWHKEHVTFDLWGNSHGLQSKVQGIVRSRLFEMAGVVGTERLVFQCSPGTQFAGFADLMFFRLRVQEQEQLE